jgi:hypothetical protein
MGTCVSLLLGWKYVEGIPRTTSTIETDWTITRQRKEERINSQEIARQTPFYSEETTQPYTVDMSTSASTQTVLTVIKDEFAEVLTEGTLSQITKPTDWNVIITEKMLLKGTRTPSPPPEEIRHGLAALYDNTFPTHEEYHEFAANCLKKWGNTLDYKLFDTLYLTHRYHVRTIKNL